MNASATTFKVVRISCLSSCFRASPRNSRRSRVSEAMTRLTRARSFTTDSSRSVRSYRDLAAMNRLSRSVQYSEDPDRSNTSTPNTALPRLVVALAEQHMLDQPRELREAETRKPSGEPIAPITRSSTMLETSTSACHSASRSTQTRERDPRRRYMISTEDNMGKVLLRAKTFVARSLGRTKRSVQVSHEY